MNRWRQAAGIHSKHILYSLPKDHQHIGAGSFHYKIHLVCQVYSNYFIYTDELQSVWAFE